MATKSFASLTQIYNQHLAKVLHENKAEPYQDHLASLEQELAQDVRLEIEHLVDKTLELCAKYKSRAKAEVHQNIPTKFKKLAKAQILADINKIIPQLS